MPDVIVGALFLVGIFVWILIQVGRGSGGPPQSSAGGSDELDTVDEMVLYDEVNPPEDDDLFM